VQHLSARSNIAYLVHHLQRHTKFNCRIASENETIKPGTVYFALPGVHLILSGKKIIYGTGPDENRFKPSIDVLFRSAAIQYRERTIGVILSGLLDDGVAGMAAIKSCGGKCIVQEPVEAEYGQLPVAVIEQVKPHYTLPVSAIGHMILTIAKKRKKKVVRIPRELIEEAEIAEKVLSDIDETRELGTQSLFTCPDCGGSLFHINDHKLNRYRCFTGHAYSESGLLAKQTESIQQTLWVALRLFEERKKLLSRVFYPDGLFERKSDDIETHIKKLKSLLADLNKITSNGG
jgi:two-component system chemotaxis response regulator CheB